MTRRKPLLLAVVPFWVAVALAGCLGSVRGDRIDARSAAYRAGEPAFDLDALATVQGGAPGLDIYLALPPSSLIFRQVGGAYAAVVRWGVIVEQEGETKASLGPTDTVRVADAEATRYADPLLRQIRLDLPPGAYRVRAIVEDAESERTARREQAVVVPSPDGPPALTGLRLEGRLPSGEVGPLVAFALPAGVDSLRAVAQTLNAPEKASVVLTLGRFRADTTAAAPLGSFTPSSNSLAARGVDLASLDTVLTVHQVLGSPGQAARVETPLPAVRPGLYRVTYDLLAPQSGERLDRAARLIVVRRRDYPSVTRLGDLVEPLVYIAEPAEMRRLRATVGTPGGRRAFDRFWGERLDDRRVAGATVREYYSRVEEANRLFGNHKEGWMTDRGMIYILFGPPSYVSETPTGERWTYGSRGPGTGTLIFERTAGRYGDSVPYSVLTLTRDRQYYDAWLRIRERWRTGQIP